MIDFHLLSKSLLKVWKLFTLVNNKVRIIIYSNSILKHLIFIHLFIVDEANRAGHVIRRKTWTSVHPVVRTHPVTGWKSLFVQPGFTRSIVGLSRRESDIVLQYLFDHISGGVDFQVRFQWQENSVAVWDNRVTNHNAVFDYLDIGRRHGWRVTPQGEKPYFDPKSKSKRQDLAEKAEAEAKKKVDE